VRGLLPVALLTLAIAAPAPLVAQTDEQDALAVVVAMFDAMRAKDADGLLGLLTADARLVQTGWTPEGEPRMNVVSLSDFAERIRSATVYLDEQIWDERVRVHDNLATVDVRYAFFVDGAFSHCGVDAFQLFRSADGWKIFHVADTQRTEDCEMPPS
jgi:ketosteroid isomerase-like protein